MHGNRRTRNRVYLTLSFGTGLLTVQGWLVIQLEVCPWFVPSSPIKPKRRAQASPTILRYHKAQVLRKVAARSTLSFKFRDSHVS